MVKVYIDKVSIGDIKKYTSHNGVIQAKNLIQNAEAFSHKNIQFLDLLTGKINPLISSVYIAFSDHLPLELTPDVIYNTILQGVSCHISKNPEKYRSIFVKHEWRKELIIINDSLKKGYWDNDWEISILNLSNQIKTNLHDASIRNVVSTTFSTTTIAESVAHNAAFMDIVKHYYMYTCKTGCGIPWINIAGCKDDWIKLKQTIKSLLIPLDLQYWYNDLQTILDKFIDVFNNKPDKEFFSKICNVYEPSDSGTHESINGWITKLFLYNDTVKINPVINNDTVKINPLNFMSGMTEVNFNWDCYGVIIPMILYSGIVGITLTNDGALKPEIGWVISENRFISSKSKSVENNKKKFGILELLYEINGVDTNIRNNNNNNNSSSMDISNNNSSNNNSSSMDIINNNPSSMDNSKWDIINKKLKEVMDKMTNKSSSTINPFIKSGYILKTNMTLNNPMLPRKIYKNIQLDDHVSERSIPLIPVIYENKFDELEVSSKPSKKNRWLCWY